MSKSKIAYQIDVDHERGTISVDHLINGSRKKYFVYAAYQITPQNLAQACRAAAFELLQRADMYAHNDDFVPDFDITAQISAMLDEHKPIFS